MHRDRNTDTEVKAKQTYTHKQKQKHNKKGKKQINEEKTCNSQQIRNSKGSLGAHQLYCLFRIAPPVSATLFPHNIVQQNKNNDKIITQSSVSQSESHIHSLAFLLQLTSFVGSVLYSCVMGEFLFSLKISEIAMFAFFFKMNQVKSICDWSTVEAHVGRNLLSAVRSFLFLSFAHLNVYHAAIIWYTIAVCKKISQIPCIVGIYVIRSSRQRAATLPSLYLRQVK